MKESGVGKKLWNGMGTISVSSSVNFHYILSLFLFDSKFILTFDYFAEDEALATTEMLAYVPTSSSFLHFSGSFLKYNVPPQSPLKLKTDNKFQEFHILNTLRIQIKSIFKLPLLRNVLKNLFLYLKIIYSFLSFSALRILYSSYR